MAYSSVFRCLVVCFALGALVSATKLQESKLLQQTTKHRLERLKNELVEAKKRSINSDVKDDAESQIQSLLAAVKVTNRTAPGKPVKVTNRTASKTPVEDLTVKQELFEETDMAASKQPVKVTDEKSSEKPVKVPSLSASKTRDDDDDDDEDEDDDDDGDYYISDSIFYTAAALADEIKTQCSIDIAAIYESYSPVTLEEMNNAQKNVFDAAEKLFDTLSAAPAGFADGLKSFLDSKEYSDAKLADNINKTMEKIEKTLKNDDKQIFCAEAKIIAARLKMSLYGGTGFANGYMCNKVSVELVRYGNNASKLLKAASGDDNFLKEIASYLVEDINCYEKELEAFHKVVPSTRFTGESPLQTAAFTSDFLMGYGTVLLYHRAILIIEVSIIEICAQGGDDDDDDDNDDHNDADKSADDEKSLTNQLYKLLTKLQEASAKKKAAEAALSKRAGSNAPVRGEKTSQKESYYRKRISN